MLPRYWKWETTAHGCLLYNYVTRKIWCFRFYLFLRLHMHVGGCQLLSVERAHPWPIRNGRTPGQVPQPVCCHPQLNFGTTTELKTNDTTGKYRKSRSTTYIYVCDRRLSRNSYLSVQKLLHSNSSLRCTASKCLL